MALKMFFSCIFGLILLGYQVDGGGGGSELCEDPSVAKFTSSFYVAMLVSLDPDVFFGLYAYGKVAAEWFYDVIYNDLDTRGVCNAGPVAIAVKRAVASHHKIYLYKYYESKAIVVANYLLRNGVLNCDNAIKLAMDYFNIVLTILSKLEEKEFISHVTAISLGVVDFAEEQPIKIEESVADLAWLFYDQFNIPQ